MKSETAIGMAKLWYMQFGAHAWTKLQCLLNNNNLVQQQ